MDEPKNNRLWTKQYLLVIATNFLLYIVYYQLMLWTTSYAMHVWHADVSEAGLAAGLFIISALTARLLAGHFIDGLGRGFVLRAGTILYAAAMLPYFHITSMLEFEAVRVLHGFAYGLASTAASTIVATITPIRRQGEGIGYFTLGVTIASAIGPFLGIWFTHRGMYDASVWICTVVGFTALALSLLIRTPAHRMNDEERREMHSLRFSTFFETEALPISFIAMLGGVCYSTVLAYIGAYSQSLSLFWAGSVFFLGFALTSIVSRPVTGRLLDELGGSVVVYPALIFLALAMIVIGAARSNGMLLSGALVLGLGFATITSACHALAVFVSPQKHVGRATATYFVLLDVGVGIGPYTLGLLVPHLGFSAVYYAAAVVAMIGIVIYWAAIGRTGIFSQWTMKRVRALRLNEIEIDPAAVSRAKREGREAEIPKVPANREPHELTFN